MSSYLHRVVAVVTSVMLAFPVGLCCVDANDMHTIATQKKPTCCHKKSVKDPSESRHSDSQRSGNCCCLRDTALPAKSLVNLDWHFDAVAVVSLWERVVEPTMVVQSDSVSIPPGPRLQILHCMWRC